MHKYNKHDSVNFDITKTNSIRVGKEINQKIM